MSQNAATIQDHLQFAAALARSQRSSVLEYLITMAIMENAGACATALPTSARKR